MSSVRLAAAAVPLIWIVDDSATQAAVTEHALRASYRCEVLPDGETLIERLSAANVFPHLILLDWVMPGMSGDEVCRFVRADPRTHEVPIVILTASRTNTDSIVTGLANGANDYVAKPFVPAELHARISTILRAEEAKRLATRQRQRLEAIVRLGRALYTEGQDVRSVLDALADALVPEFCDGCAIRVRTSLLAVPAVLRHRQASADIAPFADFTKPVSRTFLDAADAIANLPAACRVYADAHGLVACSTLELPIRGNSVGYITLTHDRAPPDADDRSAIQACLDVTGLAIETALRAHAERATTRFHEEMLGIVSHDLRSPLGAIGMGIELLQESAGVSPDAVGVLGRLSRTTNRMTSIVNDLLDVTRVRLGSGITIARREVALRPLIDGVLEELRLVHRGVAFALEGPDTLGAWDPERLGQVFANLVSNDVQYGRKETTITITLAARDGVTIAVHNRNRGAPIPPRQLALLFDPFERGEARTDHGLGLGLYIVREIVRAHGGTVVAESNDEGTTFVVHMPLA